MATSSCAVTKLFEGGGGGNIHTVVTYYENTIKKGFFTLLTTLILQGNILSECVIYNVI